MMADGCTTAAALLHTHGSQSASTVRSTARNLVNSSIEPATAAVSASLPMHIHESPQVFSGRAV